ncbi:hypothetical protein B0H19DRAFT_1175568, partial [Mycena capillaripes]
MHFSSSILSIALVALTAVQAAPGPVSTLTKRDWCGFEPTCPCVSNEAKGCVLTFDKCSGQFYWPLSCTGCAPCGPLCFDSLICVPEDA